MLRQSIRKNIPNITVVSVTSLFVLLLFCSFLIFTKTALLALTRGLFPVNNMNIVSVFSCCHINFMMVLYFSFIFGAGASILILKKFALLKKSVPVKKCIFISILTVFAIFTLLQSFNRTLLFIDEIKTYGGKNITERKAMLFGFPYVFSSFCQSTFPGNHKARFISDLDTTRGPGLAIKERLIYFMYPLDINDISDSPEECAIIYCNKPPDIPAEVSQKFPVLKGVAKYYAIAIPEERTK